MKLNRKKVYREGQSHQEVAVLKEDPFEEKETHLRDYLRIVRERKNVVYMTIIMILALTLVITYSMSPMYEASAKLLIEKNRRNPLSSDYGYARRDPQFLATQVQILKSTPVALKVVRVLNLGATYDEYFNPQMNGFSLVTLKNTLFGWFTNTKITSVQIMGEAEADNKINKSDLDKVLAAKDKEIAEHISENISVKPSRDSRIVTINYESYNPVLASKIVNSVAKAYIDKTFEMKMESSSYTLKWMTEKANEVQKKLENSEHLLQKYMEKNDIITIENRETMTPQKLGEINRRLINTQARRKELEAICKRVGRLPANLRGAESIQVVATDPSFQSLRDQILEAEKNIMDLSKKYGLKHPIMQRAKADLGILRKKKNIEIKRIIRTVNNEHDLIRDNEMEFKNLLAQIKRDAVKLNEKYIQYGILEREVDTNRQLYNSLITKIKQQNVAEQAQSINVWMVENAKIPDEISKPNKQRNIILALVMGLIGGIGLALFLDYLDNTVKYPDDLEERFGLRVLGTTERLSLQDRDAPEKEVFENPNTAFAESFKTIRTAVMLSSASAPPKNLLITSMEPSEGKTTAAINLAVSMAQADRRVLLIDADMRKPRIHQAMGLKNDIGLSNFLVGASEKKAIKKSPHEMLDIITSGPIPPNPSELLSSKRTAQLIQVAEKLYDITLIDSPPVLPVSDALMLSQLVEGVILIAKSGKTTYDVFKKGKKVLESIGGRIIGVVLNAVEVNKDNSYYGHYYSYGQEEDKHSG